MRFVFATDELPEAGLAGHLALNHAIIEWLRNGGHEVTIFLTRPRLSWPIKRYGVAAVRGPGIGTWRNYVFVNRPGGVITILARQLLAKLPAGPAAYLRKIATGRRYGSVDTVIGAFISPAQAAWCADRIQSVLPDAVIVDTIFRAPLLSEPGMQKFNSVIIAPDLFYLRHRAMCLAGYRPHPSKMSRKMEAELLNLSKAVAAIQPEEAAKIEAMCPGAQVCITTIPAVPCPPPTGQEKIVGRLVFVGSDTLPNIDGLRWFFAEVWPRLQHMYPEATLDLVGDCATTIGRLPAGVQRLGRVADLSSILHHAMLAIAPMRVSSGLKIKILDYARHGLITVATPESLNGFVLGPDAPFVAAPDGPAFAHEIAVMLHRADIADGHHALNYVTRHYNAEISFSGLTGLLNIPANRAD